MNPGEFSAYLAASFGCTGEQLFARYPDFRVFRHAGSKKWFAVIMTIPARNLGLPEQGSLCVVNLKCDTRLIGSFRSEPGIFPGWHMNKAHWLSVALDGRVEAQKLKFLVEMSYELTKR